jgi:hypothetical protein
VKNVLNAHRRRRQLQQQQHRQDHRQQEREQLKNLREQDQDQYHDFELDDVTCNTPRCCAERRLLSACVEDARRHGVPRMREAAWIRRKFGNTLHIWRCRRDGSLGCSMPCCFCYKAIETFALRVSCVTPDGKPFLGYVDELPMPPKLTSMQRKNLDSK